MSQNPAGPGATNPQPTTDNSSGTDKATDHQGQPDFHAIALQARAAGLNVLPPTEDGTKRPDTDEWASYQNTATTPEQIAAWYRSGRRNGIGIVCGAISGGLELLDFDNEDTWHQFRELADATGGGDLLDRIIDGYVEMTPRPGVHLLYRCNSPSSMKLAQAMGADGRTVTLIETKGEGGYAVIAPSGGGVHPSGRHYRLLCGGVSTIATVTEVERDFLHSIARSLHRIERLVLTEAKTTTRSVWAVRPGDDFAQARTWAEILEPHGWVRVLDHGGRHYWRRPGKAKGWSATVSDDGDGLLYVFTTSTTLDADRAYGKFAAYAVLNHAGDFHAAAQALHRDGYGQPLPTRSLPPGTIPTVNTNPWPVLDRAALCGLVGDIVTALDPETEADPVAILVQFMVAFGNLIGRGPHFVAEQKQHFTNLFAVLVGPTSKGRKGSSWSQVTAIMERVVNTWLAANVTHGLSSGEGLIWAVRDEITKTTFDKASGQSVTIVVEEGVTDKRLLVVEEEFVSVLKAANREGNILSPVLRQAWDGSVLSTLTKNSAARATDAHISVIGHTTKEEVTRTLRATEAANGFANRFAWFAVRRSKSLPEGGRVADAVLDDLARRVTKAVQFATATGRLERSLPAKDLWAAVYEDLASGRPGLVGAICGRAEAQVMRFATIYALLDLSPVIDADHLKAGLALWRYAEDSARWAFGDALGDPVADQVLDALKAAGSTGVTRTDLSKLFNRHKASDEISRALVALRDAGLARSEVTETKGFPTETWFWTPAGR